jgi:hypothetical protein
MSKKVSVRYDAKNKLVGVPILLLAEIVACAKKTSQKSCNANPNDPYFEEFHAHLKGIWEGLLATGDLPEFYALPWDKV